MKNPYFPFYMNIEKCRCIIVGAGKIGMRRVHSLLDTGVDITLIFKEISPENKCLLEQWEKEYSLHGCRKAYEPEDISTEPERRPDFVLAATDDAALNDLIGERCRQLHIPVNIASDRSRSDFYFPAVIRDEEIVIGVSGNGSNHKRVAVIAAEIRSILTEKQKAKRPIC